MPNGYDPFEELKVLGARDPRVAAAYFTAVGDVDTAHRLEQARPEHLRASTGDLLRWPFNDRPWQYTAHAYGYIPPHAAGNTPISFPGSIKPETSLRKAAITITLDRLRVAEYPGRGTHRILFDFYARNQTGENTQEDLHFNATFRALEGQEAAVLGYPIFVGLNIGGDGLALRCFTVNVKNDDDEKFLAFLESDVFRSGLKLATTLQPAIAPLSAMAVGLTKAIAGRHRNVPVQDFYMGLDFGSVSTGARLAQGSYIAVQIPDKLERIWDWNEWTYDGTTGHIVAKNDQRTLIPFNYIVFGVSRHDHAS